MRNAPRRAIAALCLAAAAAWTLPGGAAAASAAPPAGGWKFDTSVSPCDDFYQHVCGSWMKENPIPPDQPAWSRLAEINLRNRQKLRQILETASADDPRRSPAERQIGDFYASCMDEKGIEAKGTAPLAPELARIAALRSKGELAPLLGHLHRSAIPVFFLFAAEPDFKDSTAVIASLGPGGMGLPGRDSYLKDDAKQVEQRQAYAAHVERLLALAGEPPAEASADAAAVLAVETALARASLDAASRRDPAKRYHRMSLQELAALAPELDWSAYLAALQVPASAPINVREPAYAQGVGKLIAATDLARLKAYLRWQLIHTETFVLPAAFENETFAFYGRTLVGTKSQLPRWRRCVATTDRSLGEALGRVYVERNVPPAAKARTQEMARAVERALEADISTLPWMTAATRQQALAKLRLVANRIGYPDVWRDYGKVEIVRGDALGNLWRAQAFETARQLARIGKPLDRGEWDVTPPTVNAFYDPALNAITLPAGHLQPPAFDPARDEAYNLGAIGFTIAHELTHGFDDEGRQFDGHGNLRDWWTPADVKEFEARTACLVEQYSGYTVGDAKLNSRLTVGEDVADNGGAHVAFMVLESSYKDRAPSLVDGLTPEQRFFVGRAQMSCESRTPQLERQLARSDPHSPNRYRVNGVFSNMPEFQRAFGCPDGAPMVRKNVCRVW